MRMSIYMCKYAYIETIEHVLSFNSNTYDIHTRTLAKQFLIRTHFFDTQTHMHRSYAYVYAYQRMHTLYAYTCTCMRINICVSYVYAFLHIQTSYAYACTCMRINVCIHVCIHGVCVSTYACIRLLHTVCLGLVVAHTDSPAPTNSHTLYIYTYNPATTTPTHPHIYTPTHLAPKNRC